jgi:hypothetical protein
MLSELHESFIVKKTFEAFAASSCTDEAASKNCLTNGWLVQFSLASFFNFAPAIKFSYLKYKPP